MTLTEITRLIRRGIREPKPKFVDADDITASIADAINVIGQRLLAAEPEYFKKRVSLNSNTNIFSLPSGCDRVLRVWDLGKNAFSVSATADNGSGLVRITTSAVHGLSTGDIGTIHDIAGTTEANGTWYVTVSDTTNFDSLSYGIYVYFHQMALWWPHIRHSSTGKNRLFFRPLRGLVGLPLFGNAPSMP